jgi:hypothetical protein
VIVRPSWFGALFFGVTSEHLYFLEDEQPDVLVLSSQGTALAYKCSDCGMVLIEKPIPLKPRWWEKLFGEPKRN